ncbi:SurA N-terminal domain-containing protein [Brevibacillus sp. SYSU BS000544]|uniref:SurA N-terminal domain-containing protein n=1 Tax=Brevibacillus sp. SYSU BS000544 TaxID=3416443 RepID=UPI003CE4C82F
MKKFDLSLLTISILVVGVILLQMSKGEATITAAKVNNTIITEGQYISKLKESDRGQTLDFLVTEELIKQEANKKGVTVTTEDVDQEFKKWKDSVGSEEQYKQMLDQYGTTEKQLKEQMKSSLLIDKILKDELKVTQEEIKKYYDENKDQFGTANFEEMKEKIEQMLVNQMKQEKIPSWIDELKKNAIIEK